MPTERTKFLQLARDRFRQAETADQKQRERELQDLRFYAGEQWEQDVLDSRKGQVLGSGSNQQVVPARPCLTINKTREPVRQVLNQERQSDLGIELIPADDFGEMGGPIDHTEIELREGLVRRIQRDSEAADARTWAFARATIAGRGYWGVMTRYVPGKSWDQEIYVQRFYNQASVLLDPTHEQPDGSDADWGFVGGDIPINQYAAEHSTRNGKKNRLVGVSNEEWRALGDEAPGWFTSEGDVRSVRVVDYYYTDRTSRELVLLTDGQTVWRDELPEDFPKDSIKETRTVVEKTIKWCKIDGCDDDVLEETDWLGHYIPIIKVVGEELQPFGNERRCEGIVRPMIHPCRGNNYIISKFVERVGLSPISPWMMATGQDEGYEAEYDAANTRALSRLHYNVVDSFGKPVSPPFRTDARSEVGDLAFGVQVFGQAIQSTSVVPDTALGQADSTVKSGRLANLLIRQAEQGTSNFLDNLVRSMRHEARIINDLLFPIYGRPGRLARLMNPNGEMSAVLIGQPFTMQGEGPAAKPQPAQHDQPGAKTYQLTPDAEFNVAVKVSKNYDTRREQEAATLGDLIAAAPNLMEVLGDLFFKYQDGPGHEEMSERMKAMLAPQVQALMSGKQPLPPEIQQQMQQTQQLIEAMTKELEGKTRLIETDAVKAQQRVQETAAKEQAETARLIATQQAEDARTLAELASKERIEFRKLEIELELGLAKLGSAESMARGEVEQQQLHQHNEHALAREQLQTTTAQADLDRQATKDDAALAAQEPV